MSEFTKKFYLAVYDDAFGWRGMEQIPISENDDKLNANGLNGLAHVASTKKHGVSDFLTKCGLVSEAANQYQEELIQLGDLNKDVLMSLHLVTKQRRAQTMGWQSQQLAPVEQLFVDILNSD